MNSYEKRFINAEHTAFEVYECYPDGRKVLVSPQQDILAQWLADGNAPNEVEYVAPPATPEPVAMTAAQAESLREIRYHEKCDPTLMQILAYEQELGLIAEDDPDRERIAKVLEEKKSAWLSARQSIRSEFQEGTTL